MLLNAISVIIGLIGTIALSETMSFDLERTAYGNSMGAFLFVLFAIIILRYVYSHICFTDKRGMVFAGLYSAGLSFALTAGKQLHTVENFAVGNIKLWIQILILASYFFGPVLYAIQWITQKAEEGDWCFVNKVSTVETGKQDLNGCKCARNQSVKGFLFIWLVIFLCWLPVFLAFYPGAFVYDAQDEYVQVATREFTTHHPLLHVLLLGGAVCFGNKFMGSYNAGIALYTLFQMVVFSGVLSYSIYFVMELAHDKNVIAKKWTERVLVAFYGLFPIFPMYAVCSSKDTFFHASLLIVFIHLVKICQHIFLKDREATLKRRVEVIFVIASSCMMLLRNNAVYAYAVLFFVIVFFSLLQKYKKETGRKTIYKRLLVCMLLSLLVYKAADKGLAYALHASDIESQEVLTVPIQQLARTYKYSPEVFSENDKKTLHSYIPSDVLAVYDADLSDLVKANFDNHLYAKDRASFLKLWVKIGVRKPFTYMNAWLMTSYGYWYPDTIINVYGGQDRFTFQYGDSSYFGFETEQPGTRDSKFPWLEEQYRKLSLEIYQQKVPVISMLFSPGFLFVLFAGCIVIVGYQKKYELYIPMSMILLVWLTFLLGPTFLVRYVLILWLILPIELHLALK